MFDSSVFVKSEVDYVAERVRRSMPVRPRRTRKQLVRRVSRRAGAADAVD